MNLGYGATSEHPVSSPPSSAFDEDNGDWLVSGLARAALAVALSLAPLSALCSNLQQQDEVIVSAAVTPQANEDYWLNPTAPVQASLLWTQQWTFDIQDPTGSLRGQPDEDFWTSGVAPTAGALAWPKPWSFEAPDPAGSLSGQPDEDYWSSGVAPTIATLAWPQQWAEDVQEPAGSLRGQPDEDFWLNGVAPSVASLIWPQQSVFDVQEPGGLRGQPDEDFWTSGVAPLPSALAWPQPSSFDVQEPAGSLYGVAEEEAGLPQAAPKPPAPPVIPFTDTDEIVPQGVTAPPDEDFWSSGVAPSVATLAWPQPGAFDVQEPAGSLYGVPEEDAFSPYRGSQFILPVLPWVDTDDVVQAAVSLPPDEDFWSSGVSPLAATLSWPQQWTFDVQEPDGLRGVPEEDSYAPLPRTTSIPGVPVVAIVSTEDIVPTAAPATESKLVIVSASFGTLTITGTIKSVS